MSLTGDAMTEHSVMALTQAYVAEDKSSVQIHLAAAGGTPLVLNMTPNSLGQIVAKLTELDGSVQIAAGMSSGHVRTEAAEVQAVMAQAAVGGSKVILSFRTSTGRVQSFACSLEQIQQLRLRITES